MPSTFALMDSNLPTLNDSREPEEQIYEIINYLTVMAETLKYTLQNLDTTNFNDAALSDYSEETTGDIRRSQALLDKQQKTMSDKMDELHETITTAGETLKQLVQSISRLQTNMDTISTAIAINGDTITIGGSEKTVNINGNVYINGAAK